MIVYFGVIYLEAVARAKTRVPRTIGTLPHGPNGMSFCCLDPSCCTDSAPFWTVFLTLCCTFIETLRRKVPSCQSHQVVMCLPWVLFQMSDHTRNNIMNKMHKVMLSSSAFVYLLGAKQRHHHQPEENLLIPLVGLPHNFHGV